MNYQAVFRTSYFEVKDREAFKRWLDLWSFEVGYSIHDQTEGGENLVAVSADGSIPGARRESRAIGSFVDPDFCKELASHLATGWAAIVMEAGYEGHRYVVGIASIVYSTGAVSQMSLDRWARRELILSGFEFTAPQY